MSKKARLKKEIRELVKDDIHKPFSRTRYSKRRLSERTIQERWKFYWRMVDVIYLAGYKLEKAKNLGKKHLEALFADWDKRKLKAHTVQNFLPLLRNLVGKIDKPDLITVIDAYSRRKTQEERERVDALLSSGEETSEVVDLTRGRSWSAHGVNFDRVIELVEQDDGVVAMQMMLMRAFGLRLREAHRLQPREDWRCDKLIIRRGPKGGLERLVPVVSSKQRALLKRAREIADAQGGSMMPKEYSEIRWRSHYYNVMRRNGVTRAVLGVTSHGLRHDYSEDNLGADASTATLPDPLRIRSDVELVRDRKARAAVAKCLGHSRWNITRHYLDPRATRGGVHHRLSRAGREAVEALERGEDLP